MLLVLPWRVRGNYTRAALLGMAKGSGISLRKIPFCCQEHYPHARCRSRPVVEEEEEVKIPQSVLRAFWALKRSVETAVKSDGVRHAESCIWPRLDWCNVQAQATQSAITG